MKKILMMMLTAVIAVGCEKKPTLYVYNWEDYIDPGVVEEFQLKYDCNVVIDSFEDNEGMVAKMKAGGTGYDLLFPSTYAVPVLAKSGLLKELDMSRLPAVKKNFDEKYARFRSDGFKWSVPYAFSVTGIAYRKDVMRNMTNSWHALLDSGDSRFSMLRDMREIIGIGLILNGKSVNSTNRQELMSAADTMLKFGKKALKIDCSQYKSGLLSGEFSLAMGYNSDSLQLNQNDPAAKIGFMVPAEGSTCCFDEMAIPVGGENEDLAYKFIDFMYDGNSAASNAVYTCTIIPNKEFVNGSVNAEILERLSLIEDVGGNIKAYSEAWDYFMRNIGK